MGLIDRDTYRSARVLLHLYLTGHYVAPIALRSAAVLLIAA